MFNKAFRGLDIKSSSLHFSSLPSRWSSTRATGPTKTTMIPWRVGSTSTRPTPRMAMRLSTWRGSSPRTRALTSVRWKRLLGSAAERWSWSSWVSGANRRARSLHGANSVSARGGNALNHTPFALPGCFDVIRSKNRVHNLPGGCRALVSLWYCTLCDYV